MPHSIKGPFPSFYPFSVIGGGFATSPTENFHLPPVESWWTQPSDRPRPDGRSWGWRGTGDGAWSGTVLWQPTDCRRPLSQIGRSTRWSRPRWSRCALRTRRCKCGVQWWWRFLACPVAGVNSAATWNVCATERNKLSRQAVLGKGGNRLAYDNVAPVKGRVGCRVRMFTPSHSDRHGLCVCRERTSLKYVFAVCSS